MRWASERLRSFARARRLLLALALLVGGMDGAAQADRSFAWTRPVVGREGAIDAPWVRVRETIPNSWILELLSGGEHGTIVAKLSFDHDVATRTVKIGMMQLEGGEEGPWKGRGSQLPLYETMVDMVPDGTRFETTWAARNLREYNKARFGFSAMELEQAAGRYPPSVMLEMPMEGTATPLTDPMTAARATPSFHTMTKCGVCMVAIDPGDADAGRMPHVTYVKPEPPPPPTAPPEPPRAEAPPSRRSRGWSTVRRLARANIGPAPAVLGAVAVGGVGYALGGEYGAMGAGFVYMTVIGKKLSQGAMSWRMAAAQSGVGLAAMFAADQWLQAHGASGLLRATVGIGVGSVVAGGFAGYIAKEARLLQAGSAMASTALYGVLVAEGMYHASQYLELIEANRLALAGDPAAKEAIDAISMGGNPWNPGNWLLYGANDRLGAAIRWFGF